MITSTNYHGVADVSIDRYQVRDDDKCNDHDVITITVKAEDGSLAKVTLFAKPGAVPKVAEAE